MKYPVSCIDALWLCSTGKYIIIMITVSLIPRSWLGVFYYQFHPHKLGNPFHCGNWKQVTDHVVWWSCDRFSLQIPFFPWFNFVMASMSRFQGKKAALTQVSGKFYNLDLIKTSNLNQNVTILCVCSRCMTRIGFKSRIYPGFVPGGGGVSRRFRNSRYIDLKGVGVWVVL